MQVNFVDGNLPNNVQIPARIIRTDHRHKSRTAVYPDISSVWSSIDLNVTVNLSLPFRLSDNPDVKLLGMTVAIPALRHFPIFSGAFRRTLSAIDFLKGL